MHFQSKELISDALISDIGKLQAHVNYLQSRLRQITEISAAIIYTIDEKGKFTFISDAVKPILNFTPAELLGKHFSYIMPPEEYERVSRTFVLPRLAGKRTAPEETPKLFDERRSGDRRTKNLEVKLIAKENDELRVMVGDVTGLFVNDSDADQAGSEGNGKNTGSQGIIFDITKYKIAEKERMELQRHLLENHKMDIIGRLAGKVAHDLNNKLGSIIGCAEILKLDWGEKNDELRMYVDTILSASRHAAELANRLTSIGNKDAYQMTEITLHALIDNVLELVRPMFDKTIRVDIKLTAEEDWVTGNANKIQNTILNLVSNACDAMAQNGGVLTLSTKNVKIETEIMLNGCTICPGKYIMFSIQDTGTGMDKATVCQLFKPFFTTKSSGQAIGLGLASVKECIKEHNGLIEVDSIPGLGSVFKMYFPVNS